MDITPDFFYLQIDHEPGTGTTHDGIQFATNLLSNLTAAVILSERSTRPENHFLFYRDDASLLH